MKYSLWMVSLVVFAITQIGCSKGNKLSPDDTALIKGTDRGSFVGNGQGSGLDFDGDDISPLGESISGLDSTDGLLPQDPFWNDSDALANADRPFEPIFFGFDQYSIGTEERTKIQDIANFLNTNPTSRILVEGYCDWKGTPAYNKSLGDRRANSVRNYLLDLGIDSTRIEIVSMGDELATPDADPTTAGLERKAQFVVLKDS